MDPTIRTAATGMIAQQTRVEVISNNLANVNTTGFKRSRAHFEDLLYQTAQNQQSVQGEGVQTLEEVQVGRGTRLTGVQRIMSQGALEQTGRPLDLAIEGEGYFQVQFNDGVVAYTRDGSFQISDQGALMTSSGYLVLPGATVPQDASEVTISRNGIITARTNAGSESIELGRIELARFMNESGLRAMGENLYVETEASGKPIVGFPQEPGFGRLIQGALEASNVEIVQEMVDMITAMRAYEINSKAVQTGEEMSQMTNNLIR
ncbi:MAG: flagellar basal-body rod protein FlgG [Gemmatimonadetes bacterium]|nr:MAG: flagellar basal-body rod protein FlgG [Gemmatimonadota bacterium]